MAKKKPDVQPDKPGKPNTGRQVNFRATDDFYGRLERVAGILGVDLSNLVRMILHENLPQYERRASQIESNDAEEEG